MESELKQSELAKALAGFRADMPVVKRNGTGQKGNRSYKYADLAQVETTAQPHLKKHGLAVTQPLSTDEDGHTFVNTIIRHQSGEMESTRLAVPLGEASPQEAGSVFTYYRRYAFSASLGIAIEGEDDDGEIASKPGVARHPAPEGPKASDKKPASDKQRGLIAKLAKEKGKDDEWLDKVMHGVKSSADASGVIDKLQALDDA